jgi:arylsulfatase A-like enzyme
MKNPIPLYLAFLLLSSVASLAEEPGSKPNILFIITDQQHAGMMSCTGNPHVKTPALDSLAANGARFELAYAPNPVCVPSRASMLTGIMPSRLGIETNNDYGKGRKNVTPEILAASLGQVFSQAGYETVYGGKQHLPMTMEKAGFREIEKDAGMKLAETSAAFLRQSHEKPFLLVASFINPHDICFMAISDEKKPGKIKGPAALMEAMELPAGVSRAEFFEKICPPLPGNFEVPNDEPSEILASDPRTFRAYVRNDWTEEQWRMHRWTYARLTETVDEQIAVVLKALRESGLEKNTLVVFVSDHGDMNSAHRLEHKSVFYEESARVPLIVSWKGVTQPGLVDRKHLVSTGLDLIPTFCDFAGVPKPASLKGRSVRTLAEGGTPESWPNTVVSEGGNWRMLRSERYKFTAFRSGKIREMLTDMQKDPGEMRNLATDPEFSSVLVEHRQLLKDWYAKTGETLPPEYIQSTH